MGTKKAPPRFPFFAIVEADTVRARYRDAALWRPSGHVPCAIDNHAAVPPVRVGGESSDDVQVALVRALLPRGLGHQR